MSTTKWAWSADNDVFHGQLDTVEQARNAATDYLDGTCALAGSLQTYYVSPVTAAGELVNRERLAEAIEEHLEMWLEDDVLYEDPVVALTIAQRKELGSIVVDYITKVGGFMAGKIGDSVAYTHTVSESWDGAPVDKSRPD